MTEGFKPMTPPEAHEYVKAGGDPLDTTPARQQELHEHFQRQKKLESGKLAVEMAQDAPMGTQTNPIKGPTPPGLDGPQVNFSPSHHKVRDGTAAALGTQGNPIVGPPIGSSPGVKNHGSAAGFRGPSAGADVSEALEQQARGEAEVKLHGNSSKAQRQTADNHFIDVDGSRVNVEVKEGESNEAAITRQRKEREDERKRKAEQNK